jgi:hypothetical protein
MSALTHPRAVSARASDAIGVRLVRSSLWPAREATRPFGEIAKNYRIPVGRRGEVADGDFLSRHGVQEQDAAPFLSEGGFAACLVDGHGVRWMVTAGVLPGTTVA